MAYYDFSPDATRALEHLVNKTGLSAEEIISHLVVQEALRRGALSTLEALALIFED
jgi:hypothetical protein